MIGAFGADHGNYFGEAHTIIRVKLYRGLTFPPQIYRKLLSGFRSIKPAQNLLLQSSLNCLRWANGNSNEEQIRDD